MNTKDAITDLDDLEFAIVWEYPSLVIRRLQTVPAFVNVWFANSTTPLLNAVCRFNDRKSEVVRYLLEHGAEVNVRDKEGRTPLHLAKSWYDVPKMRLLIEHGADINAADMQGRTPLHTYGLTSAATPKSVRAVRLLLQQSADPNARDHRNRTPLHTAEAGLPALKLLVSHGAELEAMDDDGRTPLHYAAKRQPEEVSFNSMMYNGQERLCTNRTYKNSSSS